MARITVEDCLKQIGNENRFALIHLAVTRIKQHRKGAPVLSKGKNKEIVMTLREIAGGKVNFDNIMALEKKESTKNPTPAVQEPPVPPEAEESIAELEQ